MSDNVEADVLMMLVKRIHENALAHGFWRSDEDLLAIRKEQLPLDEIESFVIQRKISLIMSELGEFVDEHRKLGQPDTLHFPSADDIRYSMVEELADVVIRVLDLAGWLEKTWGGIAPFEQVMLNKMKANESRPVMHGGKLF